MAQGYLRPARAELLFCDLLDALGLDRALSPGEAAFSGLAFLAPGDFANALRQARLCPSVRTPEALMAILRREEQGKPEAGRGRKVGFV